MGKTGSTRAASYTGGTIDNSDWVDAVGQGLKNASFGVFAYQTGSADWASDSYVAEFMYNQNVNWNNTNSYWTYAPVKYWPNGIDNANNANNPSNTATENGIQKLSFFAYAPYAASQDPVNKESYVAADYTKYGTNPGVTNAFKTSLFASAETNGGVIGMTGWEDAKDPWVNYVMRTSKAASGSDPAINGASTEAANGGIDLLWGLRGQYRYNETDNDPNITTVADGDLGKSYNVNLTKQTVNEKVRFLFKHALSKLGGSKQKGDGSDKTDPAQSGLWVVADIDANSTDAGVGLDNQSTYFPVEFDNTKTLVTIKSVKIRDKNTYSKEAGSKFASEQNSDWKSAGWFNIATGTWKNATIWQTTGNGATGIIGVGEVGADVATPGNLNPLIKEVGAQAWTTSYTAGDAKRLVDGGGSWTNTDGDYPVGVKTGNNRQPVYANEDNDGFMLIPSDEAQTLYVTVDYFVRTADKQLAKGYSEVEQIITNEVKLQGLEANKYYSLVLHLGLTSVKFEAIVADWAMTDDATYDETGATTEGTEVETESVWLPSNVVNSTTIAQAGTSHKSITIDGSATSASFTIEGLAASATLTTPTLPIGNITAVSGDASSEGTATVSVTLKPNYTDDVVNNTLRLEYSDGTTTTVTVRQTPATLSLAATSPIEASATTFTVTVKNGNNDAVDLSATPADGVARTLTVSPNKPVTGTDAGVVTVTCGENTSTNNITYTVTVKKGDIEETIKVVQKAALSLTLAAPASAVGTYTTPGTISFAKEAFAEYPSYTITDASSNNILPTTDGVTFTSDKSWLSITKSDERNGILSASENTESAARTATVTIKYNDAVVTFTVTQAGTGA